MKKSVAIDSRRNEIANSGSSNTEDDFLLHFYIIRDEAIDLSVPQMYHSICICNSGIISSLDTIHRSIVRWVATRVNLGHAPSSLR